MHHRPLPLPGHVADDDGRELSDRRRLSVRCRDVRAEGATRGAAVAACHCHQCQKLSSSAFSITALVASDDIDIRGEMREWSRIAASGNTSAAKPCKGCGNHIYHFNPDEPSRIMLKPSTLADTRIIEPTIHVWVGEKQDWVVIPDDATTFVTQP